MVQYNFKEDSMLFLYFFLAMTKQRKYTANIGGIYFQLCRLTKTDHLDKNQSLGFHIPIGPWMKHDKELPLKSPLCRKTLLTPPAAFAADSWLSV